MPTSIAAANFIDSSNNYTKRHLRAAHRPSSRQDKRDRLTIATKYLLGQATRPDDPNSGGDHRKSMVSLRSSAASPGLQTD